MKLNDQSLAVTASQFKHALIARNLKLPHHARLNAWSQILFAKNYSAAMAEARAKGFIAAGPVSTGSIISVLAKKHLIIDHQTATELFAEAIGSELPNISDYFSRLPVVVKENENASLTGSLGDQIAGIGIIQGHIAGYLPVSEFLLPLGSESEMKWIRENRMFVVNVANYFAGQTDKQAAEIYFANHRAGSDKQDQRFISYLRQNLKEVSTSIAKEVFELVDSMEREDWESEISFDEIKDIGFDVLERKLRKTSESWLKPDCNAGGAVINHIAGNVRETLKMLSNDDRFFEECESIEESIAHSAEIATRHILGLQRAMSAAA